MSINMDNTLYTTKPVQSDRPKKETDTYELLDQLGIAYVRIDHEVTATIEDCAEVEKLLGVEISKNLFLCNTQKTNFYLLIMPGRKKFRTKDLSKQINTARLSFGDAEHMAKFLNIEPGSVSVLGLMNDVGHNVKLLIDKDVLEAEYIGCHPCVNTASLKIKTADLLNTFLSHTGHTPTLVEL